MASRIRVTSIELVGTARELAAWRAALAAAVADADDVQVQSLRVIQTDRPIASDQVDDVIAALNARK